MTVESPHSCSTTRITRTDGETHAAPADVLINEPCLFAPGVPLTMDVFLGPMDTSKTLLFIDALADIALGDTVTNDDTGEVYEVTEPPQKFDNPTTWEADHWQVRLTRKPIG